MTKPLRILPDAPQALPAEDVLAHFRVSTSKGLADEEARHRLKVFGSNTVVSTRKASGLVILLHQFQSPVVYLLSAAAALPFYFGELEEGASIVAVLAVNALIGFLTELKAARSIEGLRALGSRSARVRREGHSRIISAEEMVPGDIVLIEAGDAISADLRLVEASNLAADESTLTGESVAVHKHVHPVPGEARLADRTSMLFKGTALTRGSGGHALRLSPSRQRVLRRPVEPAGQKRTFAVQNGMSALPPTADIQRIGFALVFGGATKIGRRT